MENQNLNIPIRILHIGLSATYYGTENVIMNLFRNIDRTKFVFDFLFDHSIDTIEYEDEILHLGGKIYKLYYKMSEKSRKDYISPEEFFKIHQEINGVHYSVNNYSPYYRYIVAAKKRGLPIIVIHSHNSMNFLGKKTKDKLYNIYAKYSSGYYANSLLACSHVAGKWNFKNYNFTILKNAINIKDFAFEPYKRTTLREQYGLQNNIVLGFVGRLCHQKNPMFLMEIYKILKEKNINA